MRYVALATDYDGTLAADGKVAESTKAALQRFLDSGRRLILVTGRQLDDLQEVFPEVELFEWVVAENGALIYDPSTKEEKALGDPPPQEFLDALSSQSVPFAVGRVIVATREPHEVEVLEAIKELGLELQVIFNKGAVMVLPEGLNKATGLAAALDKMRLSPHNVVGVGDAENDHAFLKLCEFSVAVSNALPMVSKTADLVTEKARGEGVEELIDRIISTDLKDLECDLEDRGILLGERGDGSKLTILPDCANLLIAGPSGSGKSTITIGLIERFAEQGYQFCLIDPEGDYLRLPGAVVLGDEKLPPSHAEIMQVLARPSDSVVVNLTGIRLKGRPEFFQGLLPRLLELRAETGRPHWLVIDEAHHLMPEESETTEQVVPQELGGLILVTVHPIHLSPAVVRLVDAVLAVGKSPEQTLQDFAQSAGVEEPDLSPLELEEDRVVAWFVREGAPFTVAAEPPKTEHHRHHRKYAEGKLGEDKTFYFRGPEGKLNLKAENLSRFIQLAKGVDDDTWLHHMRRHDYSTWFRESIKDPDLADEAETIESDDSLDPHKSRQLMAEAIERRYAVQE
jgi:hydroxymethylpyrimidine pyrophosphatase-like HAD family hydrolase